MARPVVPAMAPGLSENTKPHGGSFMARGQTVGKVGKGGLGRHNR